MTHTGLDHCLGLLRGARRNVGQSPGCLELERRAAEKDEDEAVEVKRSPMIHIKVQHLPVISVQAVDQFRKDARFDEIIYGGVTVTRQQLPGKKMSKYKYFSHLHTNVAKIILK